MSFSALVDPLDDGTSFDTRWLVDGATNFTVKTLNLSCKSDAYQRREHKYGGIIIYGRNGQGDWRTANGTHCMSGYVVIMQTDTTAFKDLQTKWNEPGKVHGIIYRKAFGESLKDPEVTAVGEGFGLQHDTTTKSFEFGATVLGSTFETAAVPF